MVDKLSSFLVGKTRSEKEIYCAVEREEAEWVLTTKHPDFSSDDHFDVYCVFEFLSVRAKRKLGKFSKDYYLFAAHSRVTRILFFDDEQIGHLMVKNKLITSLDVCKFGSRLVTIEFADL